MSDDVPNPSPPARRSVRLGRQRLALSVQWRRVLRTFKRYAQDHASQADSDDRH